MNSPTSASVKPMPDALIAGALVGFLGGLVLTGLVVGIGVPVGPALGTWWNLVFFALWVGGGALLAALSWRATSLRFEADRLVITRSIGLRRRIPWEHVDRVEAVLMTGESGAVTGRWLRLVVRRHPDVPVPPKPTGWKEIQEWNRQHYRRIPLGIQVKDYPVDARNRFDRMRHRTRQSVQEELESRGFTIRT